MTSFGFGGFSFFFTLIPIIIMLGFFFIFGVTIVIILKSIREGRKNQQAPVLTVLATVVAKRTGVSNYHHAGEHHHNHTFSRYYVTFQVESGDRMEFSLSGAEYGMLVEQDIGNLTFQGTQYHGFERLH